jgi:hypothetical protein
MCHAEGKKAEAKRNASKIIEKLFLYTYIIFKKQGT